LYLASPAAPVADSAFTGNCAFIVPEKDRVAAADTGKIWLANWTEDFRGTCLARGALSKGRNIFSGEMQLKTTVRKEGLGWC